MNIAEALFEPHYGLAIRREAEMAGLDDAGVHRPDRNLVQILAFHREEEKRRGPGRLFGVRPERLHDLPGAEIKPRAQVPQAGGLEPIEIADRALEPDRRGMHRADRGKPSLATLISHDSTLACALVEQRHVRSSLLCPKAHQRPAAGGEIARDGAPRRIVYHDARPRPVRGRLAQVRDRVDEAHRYPST